MVLNELPPELHEHIVRLACEDVEDDDRTPSSLALSLVSSYWASLARPYRFLTIRLTGLRSLPELLAQLEALQPKERRVRVLRVSDSGTGADNKYAPEDHLLGTHFAHQARLVRLLALLAPTLRVLALRLTHLVPATALFAYVWELRFPTLETLEMHGYYPFPRPRLSSPTVESESQPESGASNFPLLRTLVLDGVGNPYGLLQAGSLDAALPRLKILEIRGLKCAPYFALQVRDALSWRIPGCTWPNMSQSALPPVLSTLSLVVAEVEDIGSRTLSRREVLMREQMMVEIESLLKFVNATSWAEGDVINVRVLPDASPLRPSDGKSALT